ncbi:hypothetical protein [Erinnyis ello granulovirus]|uniref:Uncharacterized protein n=1 Tax=Erinnyis ello granulovirus TaxID=307444 RepID=A0A097DAM0_9BBAC|nr:hypothetical protein [Erinnyis ello granulovirus]AIS92069.1 hypothetical protein [Erinnyis ello granulovirus]ARX71409.1 hypothetical protein EREL_070 [Erinnyis ello granulovirus]ARX71539.1 hypothetical protein EREL_070 [Erinnyis ello granulovirus]ARX71669.1 hypothetical protein EREL_070 [Erinnyis ello granulovirus]ARX71799.1 hypothetical protein EREL_070 [Erinnyis ello granulovirus]
MCVRKGRNKTIELSNEFTCYICGQPCDITDINDFDLWTFCRPVFCNECVT